MLYNSLNEFKRLPLVILPRERTRLLYQTRTKSPRHQNHVVNEAEFPAMQMNSRDCSKCQSITHRRSRRSGQGSMNESVFFSIVARVFSSSTIKLSVCRPNLVVQLSYRTSPTKLRVRFQRISHNGRSLALRTAEKPHAKRVF